MHLTRRDLLKLGGLTLAGTAVAPATARGQAPRRGGTLTVRAWDPPHFDPMLTVSYKTHVALSFTHSRLLKHRAGPGIAPGTFPIEGDLAESWSQPNETAYVFKLRRGVRWHPKPPVNGRELTAQDVVYSVERFLTVNGNANAYMLRAIDKIEAPDPYTVRFTLKEPFAWFLDMLANPHAVATEASRRARGRRRPGAPPHGGLRRVDRAVWLRREHPRGSHDTPGPPPLARHGQPEP
jgi:ABC-type transport system substrate-binding protein